MKYTIEDDEPNEPPDTPWWELLDETAQAVAYNYDEIQRTGSDELKEAVAIILGGYAPGGKPIKESEPA